VEAGTADLGGAVALDFGLFGTVATCAIGPFYDPNKLLRIVDIYAYVFTVGTIDAKDNDIGIASQEFVGGTPTADYYIAKAVGACVILKTANTFYSYQQGSTGWTTLNAAATDKFGIIPDPAKPLMHVIAAMGAATAPAVVRFGAKLRFIED